MNQRRNSYCNSGDSGNGPAGGPSRRIITGGFLQEQNQCRESG